MSLASFLAIPAALLIASAAVRAAAPPPELVVFTYDSLSGKEGWLTSLLPGFESSCACKVRVLASGDAGQMAARLQLDHERGKPAAHVAVGVDQYQWARVKALSDPWKEWRPAGLEQVRPELRQGLSGEGFLPFDYGVFAFMLDEREWKARFPALQPPASVVDLLRPELKRSILLEDPRTSTPGQAFALFLVETRGEGARETIARLRPQWLTLAPGWSQAYGIFLKGEAPLVWSYTTSQAYHRERGDAEGRYRALVFREGNPIQIEGAFVVGGAHQTAATRTLARKFLEHLISPEAQASLPARQWMLPARKDAKLPASFASVPEPIRGLRLPEDPARIESALKVWDQAIRQGAPAR